MRLLQAVGKTTGREMVLNTSFNVKGQPIVNTPGEAIETFLGTGIEFLFLENNLVSRPHRLSEMDPKARKQTLRMFSNGVYYHHVGEWRPFWRRHRHLDLAGIVHTTPADGGDSEDSNVFRCMQESQVAAVHLVGRTRRASHSASLRRQKWKTGL